MSCRNLQIGEAQTSYDGDAENDSELERGELSLHIYPTVGFGLTAILSDSGATAVGGKNGQNRQFGLGLLPQLYGLGIKAKRNHSISCILNVPACLEVVK